VDARSCARLLLGLLALATLGTAVEAQGKRGKGKRPPAAGKANPGGGGGGGGNLLPGLDAPTPQGKKPTGPKGKGKAPAKGAAAAKPAAPPDPMKEADRVAAEAEARRALESAEDRRLRELFVLCDLDHNGWLSLREAELVLSFDRAEYRRADLDQDGRLVQKELASQKTLVFARLGAPPEPEPSPSPPAPEAPAPAAPESATAAPTPAAEVPLAPRARAREALALPGVFPRPSDLLQRYDQDASQALDAAEVERLLVDLGLDLSAPLLVAQMDPDKSGALAAVELLPLSLLASKHMPEALRPNARKAQAAPPVASAPPAKEAPARPSALAAMTPFGRLDRDHDGFISEQDLRSMEGLARLDARVGVLLAALDGDGDRRLSRDEFERAMQDAPADSKPSDQ